MRLLNLEAEKGAGPADQASGPVGSSGTALSATGAADGPGPGPGAAPVPARARGPAPVPRTGRRQRVRAKEGNPSHCVPDEHEVRLRPDGTDALRFTSADPRAGNPKARAERVS